MLYQVVQPVLEGGEEVPNCVELIIHPSKLAVGALKVLQGIVKLVRPGLSGGTFGRLQLPLCITDARAVSSWRRYSGKMLCTRLVPLDGQFVYFVVHNGFVHFTQPSILCIANVV